MTRATIILPAFARIFAYLPFQRKRTRTLPNQWSELRLRHFPALEAFFQEVATTAPDDATGIATAAATLFCRWMGISTLWTSVDTLRLNPDIANIGLQFLTRKHTTTPLHRLTLWMHGPGSQLTRLRFQQFILAETIFEEYRQSGSATDIRKLAAITHRAAFMPYLHGLSSIRYYIFCGLPIAFSVRALFTYIGQRSHLPTRYPELYKPASAKGNHLYIDQQILNQCGPEIGNFSDVASAPVHRVLEFMQLKERIALKNNPKYAKQHATVEELHARVGYKQRPRWAS